MEVTNKNFCQVLPNIIKKLDDCEFVAIDTEMTGIPFLNPYNSYNEDFDSRYERLKAECTKFNIVQFGLCPVIFDPIEARYVAYPFNFYVYPHKAYNLSADSVFLCDASCMSFLSENGFDFNKWISEGVPYLRSAEECVILEKINQEISYIEKMLKMEDGDEFTTTISIPPDLEPIFSHIFTQVDEMLAYRLTPWVDVQVVTDRFLRYLRKGLKVRYHKKINTSILMEGDIKIMRIKTQFSVERIEELKNAKTYLSGFTLVMRKLFATRKPIVGHNLLIDLMMSLKQFYVALPKEEYGFRELVNQLMPRIYDTKMMAFYHLICDNRNTALSGLHDSLISKGLHKTAEISLDGSLAKYGEAGRMHEAGYDAYITACCFVYLACSFNNNTRKINYMEVDMMELQNKIHLSNMEVPIFDLNVERGNNNQEQVIICWFNEPPYKIDLVKLLEGYKISWNGNQSLVVVGPHLFNDNEIDRIKLLFSCNHVKAHIKSSFLGESG